MSQNIVTLDAETYERLTQELADLRQQVIKLQHLERDQQLTDTESELLVFFNTMRIRDITACKQAEEQLRQSEERFRGLVETINDWIWEVDYRATYTYASPQVEALLGYKPEEIIGKTPFDLMPPNEAQRIAAAFSSIAATKQPFEQLENINIHKDGHFVVLETSGVPFFDREGNLLGYRGVDRNISDRKRAEAALRQSQQLLQMIMDTVPQSIFWKDRNSVYQGCNYNFARVAGLNSPADIVGKTDYDLPWTREESDWYRECDHRVMASGQSELHITETQLQADGHQVWLDTSKLPLFDAEGKVIGILGTYDDVTERKAAEVALAKSEAKFRRLVEDANDVIFSFSSDGLFTYISPKFTEFFGYDPSDFLGQPFALLVHPDDLLNLLASMQKLVETGEKQFGLEFRHKRKDGNWCWVTANTSPIKDSARNITGFQGVLRDISNLKRNETKRKAAEAALQQSEAHLRQKNQELEQTLQELQRTQTQMIQSEKMSSLGQLVAGVAHEINNPVSFIYGNINPATDYVQDLLGLMQLYQQHYADPVPAIQAEADAIDLDFLIDDLPKLLKSMKVGAERIQNIVLSLRTFSRMDESEMKRVDIHEGIDSTLMILQNRLKAEGDQLPIQVIKEYGDLPLVQCYAGQLNQVFMNLVSNAIDAIEEAMGDGEWGMSSAERSAPTPHFPLPTPTIRIHTEVTTNQHVQIRIADNGPGITEANKSKIFNPFFTTKPVGKGTGLGLSLSYQIVVEKHQGQFECHSTPGQGTEFVIKIPQKQLLQTPCDRQSKSN